MTADTITCQCGAELPGWMTYHRPDRGEAHYVVAEHPPRKGTESHGMERAKSGQLPDDRPEKAIQAGIKRVLTDAGAYVYDMSQPRAAMQTPGIPDLLVYWRDRWTWAEIKRPRKKLSDAQQAFRVRCMEVGAPWALWRSERDAVAWMESEQTEAA